MPKNKINSHNFPSFYYVDCVVFGNSFKFRTDHVFLALCLVVAANDWVTIHRHYAIADFCFLLCWAITRKVDTHEWCEGKNRLTWRDDESKLRKRKLYHFHFAGKSMRGCQFSRRKRGKCNSKILRSNHVVTASLRN